MDFVVLENAQHTGGLVSISRLLRRAMVQASTQNVVGRPRAEFKGLLESCLMEKEQNTILYMYPDEYNFGTLRNTMVDIFLEKFAL